MAVALVTRIFQKKVVVMVNNTVRVKMVADKLIDNCLFVPAKTKEDHGESYIYLIHQLEQWIFFEIWSILIGGKVYYLQETDVGFIEIF